MDTEQESYLGADAAIVVNQFGSGVLPESATPRTLWDSEILSAESAALVEAGDFDGQGIQTTLQPTDTVQGNQLAVTLSMSPVFGTLPVEVFVVGLNFDGELQCDQFAFLTNETQVSARHYTQILAFFFNNFLGNQNCSRPIGGDIVVAEAASYQLSRDPKMASQDVWPDLLWRDFKVADPGKSLEQTIQDGIGPEYNVDALDINTTPKQERFLAEDDITSRIGQKFKAEGNNIQKVTLLLAVDNLGDIVTQDFDWTGDLVITIFPLQTTIACPTDIVPELAIDFDPDPAPLVQISINQAELALRGYVLTDVLQPVDFVFSATPVANPALPVVQPGLYYAVTIGRSGAADTNTIITATGGDRDLDGRLTLFAGTWVDVPTEDLWFQVWCDAGKIASGMAYDLGKGIEVPKVKKNELGVDIDYSLSHQDFASQSGTNTGLVQAVDDEFQEEQDERTGNPVFSRQQYEPTFSFILDPEDLDPSTDPLIIGCAEDANPVLTDGYAGNTVLPGLVTGNVFTIIDPGPALLTPNLLGSILVPDTSQPDNVYRIQRVLSCIDAYGDVDGNGVIDGYDVALALELVGEGLGLPLTQAKILDGYFTTLEMLRANVTGGPVITTADVLLIQAFVNRTVDGFPLVGSSFDHMELEVGRPTGRYDGYYSCCDGYVRVPPSDVPVPASSLSPEDLIYYGYDGLPDIRADDPVFGDGYLFPGADFSVIPSAFWQPYLLQFASDARLMPAAFTSDVGTVVAACVTPLVSSCTDLTSGSPTCDPGANNIFFPDDVIIGKGEIKRPDGNFYKVDYEVGIVILELPETPLVEAKINLFDKFVADAGDGMTSGGFPAMRFADCTTVSKAGLSLNQVRFDVSIQAFNPNLDGYSELDGYGIIVDDIIGVYIDPATGLLTLTLRDLEVSDIFLTLVTKIQFLAHLKKGGWNNAPLTVEPNQIEGLLST